MQTSSLVTEKSSYRPEHEMERMRSLEGAQLASFLLRGCAFGIDLMLAFGVFLLLALYVAEPISELFGLKKTKWSFFVGGESPLETIVFLAIFFGLCLYVGKGQTVGKWLMGIRVISVAHDKISLFHCVERALGYFVSMGECSFGFIQYFIHPNHRTAHDRLAETIVIQDRRDRAANMVFERRVRVGLAVFVVLMIGLGFAGLFKNVKVDARWGLPSAESSEKK